MKKTNIQTLLLFVFATLFVFSCSENQQEEDSSEIENTDITEEEGKEESTSLDYQTLIQGHWQTENGEGKIQFENESVYNPEQEIDRTFEIEDKTITYKSAEGSYKNKIVELTKDKFVEESEDGYKTVWLRPKKTKAETSLEGEWEIKNGGMGYLKFEGNKVDMATMGLYSYTIEDDKIIFKNIKNGVDFSQKIVRMSDTELVLEKDGVKETYTKK